MPGSVPSEIVAVDVAPCAEHCTRAGPGRGPSVQPTRATSIEEKPKEPKSDWAVAGVYVYPADVFEHIRRLKPSRRGELEISDVNNTYLEQGRLGHAMLEGYWTDAGTPESFALANQLVLWEFPKFDSSRTIAPQEPDGVTIAS